MDTPMLLGISALVINGVGGILFLMNKYLKRSSCCGSVMEFRGNNTPIPQQEWPQLIVV